MPVSTTPIIQLNNNQPLTLTAKVDALLNPTDTLLWEHEFVRGMKDIYWGGTYTLSWDGENIDCGYGSQYIYEGGFCFTVVEGVTADAPIEIIDLDTQELLGTLSVENPTFYLNVPINGYIAFAAQQNAGLAVASIEFKQIGQWDTSGYEPIIASSGNQLTVDYRSDYSPCSGVLTARAKVYDGNDFLVATSDDLILTITSSGGGGS